MKPKDWTMLVISAANGKGLSPVQLQKTLFLLGQKLPPEVLGDAYYSFRPYNYGPFDVTIYSDAEELANEGRVNIAQMLGQRWVTYSVTQAGIVDANKLRETLPDTYCSFIDEIVSWVLGLDFPQLIRAIYSEYPEYSTNSVFRG